MTKADVTVVFVHGWGFGPNLWAPVLGRLPGVAARCLDLGFFGPSDLDPGPAVLAVGHSLGVLWLRLEHPDLPLVSINGFARFTACANLPEGVPPRLVARMRHRLDDAPRAVVDAFRARCGAGPSERDGDPDRLAWGLDLLATGDSRAAPPPRAALAGRDDPIVPATLAQAACPTIETITGGHLLPITAPDAVAGLIRRTLDTTLDMP